MLSTFLSQLQSYFSKYFVLSSLMPILTFAFINGLIGYFLFDSWRKWADDNIIRASITGGAFVTTSLVVAIVLAAYILSSLSTFLRRQLEGKGWNGFWKWFIAAQNLRRERTLNELHEAAMDKADLEHAPQWEQNMRQAQEIGQAQHTSTSYQLSPDSTIETRLDALEAKRGRYEVVDTNELREISGELESLFRTYNADLSPALVRLQGRLGMLIDYSRERAHGLHARLQNELNSNFGAQELAATKMGNIANTIQNYALRRYHCNLEVLWSNLQRVVQKDEKAHTALQEAKTQLDFLVAYFWLTLLSAMGWAIVFGWIEPSRTGFRIAALGGPLVAYMWYRAAAEQYRSFADIAMTSLDAFRLELLRDMRLNIPTDVQEERYIWENVDLLRTYGEDRNFRYEAPQP